MSKKEGKREGEKGISPRMKTYLSLVPKRNCTRCDIMIASFLGRLSEKKQTHTTEDNQNGRK